MSLMISVSGVRGIVGQSLVPAVALEFAQAYGTLLGGGRVVVGRDTRPSGPAFAAAAEAGLLATGCEVTRLGVAMTPTVGRTIREGSYDGGVIVTASHNPGQWNGLKLLDHLGVALDAQNAAKVAQMRAAGAYRLVDAQFRPVREDPDAGRRHVRAVLEAVEVPLHALRGTRVVLDSINGAGCGETPGLLAELGCEVHHVNSAPSGIFAHPPEPIRENLTQLCDVVRESRAAVGFAQDPDADRLALVDEHGVYVGEEYTLALAVRAVLMRRPGPVAANLSTSRMIDDVAAAFRVPVHRAAVGESNVARAMIKHGCVIGGEGNGGVIDPRISHVRDSLSAISLVLQLMAGTGRTLSALVAEMPRYVTIKRKFALPQERVSGAVSAIVSAYAEYQPDTSDGVRVDFPDGWVHFRASNTEPIARLIAEAPDEPRAAELMSVVCAAADLPCN